ncbi:unnamed protein product, partial [Ectocarpus sp. 4 AP-2014]
MEVGTIFQRSQLVLDNALLSGDPQQIGDAHSSLAKLHRGFTYSYDSILYHSDRALSFYLKAGNQLKMAGSYLNLGYAHGNKLSFLSAEENIMKAIAIYEELDIPPQLSGAYGLLSYIFYLSNTYEDAIKYGEQSYSIAKSVQDTANVIEALTYLVPAYVELGQNSLALTKANECLHWINSYEKHTSVQLMDLYHYR